MPGQTTSGSRAYRLFEIWSDWLRVRVWVALIGLRSGLGLGLVLLLSYTVCVNHFHEQVVSNLPFWGDFGSPLSVREPLTGTHTTRMVALENISWDSTHVQERPAPNVVQDASLVGQGGVFRPPTFLFVRNATKTRCAAP